MCLHWAGTNLAERPQGLWREVQLTEHTRDFVCEVELRSFQSMRPIWSQIMQLEHTRMAMLLHHLRTIPRFVPGQMIVQARVDASDVVQDAFLEAWRRLGEYLEQPKMPFYIWLRAITGHKLIALHRFHLGTEKRAAGRDVSIYGGAMPETSCAGMAAQLVDEQTRASEAAIRGEIEAKLLG